MKIVISMSLSNMPRLDREDILVRITVANRGPEAATLELSPDVVVSQYLVMGIRMPHDLY